MKRIFTTLLAIVLPAELVKTGLTPTEATEAFAASVGFLRNLLLPTLDTAKGPIRRIR